MGIDCRIYVRTEDGRPPEIERDWPKGVYLRLNDHENGPQMAKFYIETPWRYWHPGYPRGPWPQISALLLMLLTALNTEVVWYYGDSSDYAHTIRQFSKRELLEYTAAYLGEEW